MTAPVIQHESTAGRDVVAFALPAPMTLDSAPVPIDPAVRVRAVPERLAAAARYSGRWSQDSYERHLAELRDAVATAGRLPTGAPPVRTVRPALQALVPAPQRGRPGCRAGYRLRLWLGPDYALSAKRITAPTA